MKKALTLFLLGMILLAECAKQAPVKQTAPQGPVTTPLDSSLQGSDNLQQDLSTDELDTVDDDLGSLDQDLANI